MVKSGTYDSCAFFDAIPSGITFIPGTIRVLTNEGKIYKQFIDAVTDDPGWINGSNIHINLGFNTAAPTASRREELATLINLHFTGVRVLRSLRSVLK